MQEIKFYAHACIVVSALIAIWGTIAYIRGIIYKGKKPNLVTWLIWAAAPLISVGASLSAGADPWVSGRVLLAGINPLAIVIVALLYKKSQWKLNSFDYICFGLSIGALIMW